MLVKYAETYGSPMEPGKALPAGDEREDPVMLQVWNVGYHNKPSGVIRPLDSHSLRTRLASNVAPAYTLSHSKNISHFRAFVQLSKCEQSVERAMASMPPDFTIHPSQLDTHEGADVRVYTLALFISGCALYLVHGRGLPLWAPRLTGRIPSRPGALSS